MREREDDGGRNDGGSFERTVHKRTTRTYDDLEGLDSIEIEELLPQLRIDSFEEVESTAGEEGRKVREVSFDFSLDLESSPFEENALP